MKYIDAMQTIGLIGGMSWESTLPYYRIINETVRDTLGGLHSAWLLLHSVDFHEIETLQHAGDWDAAGEAMAAAARSLQAGGADFVVLCTNTMHKVADAITHRGHAAAAAAHRRWHRRCARGRRHHPRRPARHALHDGAGVLPPAA
jgi:hypothetical protein